MPSTSCTFTYPLPGPGVSSGLPQLNDTLRAVKGHWGAYSVTKRRITREVAHLYATTVRHFAGPVQLTCDWFPRDQRVDPDNLTHGLKYILDGLVWAKVLPGDGYRWIRSIHHVFHAPDAQYPRVTITITPQDTP